MSMLIHRVWQPALSDLRILTRPLPTVLLLASADILALALAAWVSVELRLAWDGQFLPSLYWRLWPLLGIFPLAYGVAGLYPGVGVGPVDELRRVSLTSTLIYLCFGVGIFLFREGESYSRGIFLMMWLLSIMAVLLSRFFLRLCCARCHWWGYPVLVLGAGKTGAMVVRLLHRQPQLGLKPIAILDDDKTKHGVLEGVPVVGELAMAPHLAKKWHIPYAIAAMPGVQREKLLPILERYGSTFSHMLIIPDLFGISSLWVATRDLGGVLGLEVRQQLLLPGPKLAKTILDWSLAAIIGCLALPLLVAIALLVKLDSPGSIFYGHTRIGKNGRSFKAWKFRTMVPNGKEVLAQYLAHNPEAKALWEQDQKLRHDPRVTRIGSILRRTSLDELPQLWNVLCREMSLVGPRPIVDDEVWRYGNIFDLYTQVLPGVTGLWQVSGRNNVSYEERVNFDAYYVRNWSVWLDIYILIRTIWVVLIGDGAY